MDNMMEHNGEINLLDYAKDLLRWSSEGFSELGDKGGMGGFF